MRNTKLKIENVKTKKLSVIYLEHLFLFPKEFKRINIKIPDK